MRIKLDAIKTFIQGKIAWYSKMKIYKVQYGSFCSVSDELKTAGGEYLLEQAKTRFQKAALLAVVRYKIRPVSLNFYVKPGLDYTTLGWKLNAVQCPKVMYESWLSSNLKLEWWTDAKD